MDNENPDNINDKIEAKNDDDNNIKINKDENDDIDNFNIIENEDESDDEQNEAFIQDLMKQGKYSEVIKFLESKDKKIKLKNKDKDNNDIGNINEGNDNQNLDQDEDEELVIIPADDISELHGDNYNVLSDVDNLKSGDENNKNEEKNIDKENSNENNNNNDNKENEIKDLNVNKNDINNKNIENNQEDNKKIEDNKKSLTNNFIENKTLDNGNKNKNKDDNNDENNTEEKKQDNIIKKEQKDSKEENNKVSQNNNDVNEDIKNDNEIKEKNKNLDEQDNNEIKDNKENDVKDVQNNNINNDNGNSDKLNNNTIKNEKPNDNDNDNHNNSKNENDNGEEIRPTDIIKNIISNNNSAPENAKMKKDNSSDSLSSSLLHLSIEEDDENQKYLEERLKEIQEQRKIFEEKTAPDQNAAVNDLELLTKELEELNELENNENEDLNGIEQMNEMYMMVQEDKQSSLLQEKVREKLFPFYNKANFDINDAIKNEYFKSINFNRNFFISSKIFDAKTISKRRNNINFNIEYPKSIFDNLKFDKSDIKSGLDFDEYLDEFLEEKSTQNTTTNKVTDKIIKNTNSKVEKMLLSFKNKIKEKTKKENNKQMNNIKPIKILLNKNKREKEKDKNKNDNSNIKERYEVNIDEIYNKYKDSMSSFEKDVDLKKYNNFFVDNFNKKNEIFNFNDYSIDLDLDDDIKKELTKNTQNNIEDKDKENYYLKINNSKTLDENLLNNYSMLRFINLENNNLIKFPDFSKCSMIYSINMNNNKINKIDKISSLKYLEKLSLTNNNITAIDNCNNNKRLRFLYLGHNKISNIDNISNEVPFIEEIILCQNNINYLPNVIYLPFLKFFDLNENKISFDSNSHQLLYFICPSLEKLLLLGNNLNENGTQFLIKYCHKLKEIDLSFNKYNNIIELVKLLSINSSWNNNLEMVNVVGNTFFNSNKNKEIFYLLLRRFCPSIKYINNDEIKKNKSNLVDTVINRNILNNFYPKLNCNLDESYINIYNSQNSFMKYFTSVYFTNKIFNIYNININNNLKTNNAELFLHINQTYFQFKLSHFISQNSINSSNIGFFSFESNFQFDDLLKYLYNFKYRMTYITHSIPILVKRTWFRRMKIIKIQQQYKLRILRKKLAAIVIPDDEDDHAEDLLEFFNSGSKKEEEEKMDLDLALDKKMKEIELNIEKNMKNKRSKSKSNFQALEVIKEEDKDLDIQLLPNNTKNEKPQINNINNKVINQNITEGLNQNNNKKENVNKIKNEEVQSNVNKPILNNSNSHNIFNINNKNGISLPNENQKEKDDLVMKLLSNPKYSNNKLNPIRLTPIVKNPNTQSSSSNITDNNNSNNYNNYNHNNYNNYNHQNVDSLKRGLGISSNGNNNKIYFNEFSSNIKQNLPHKIILKDDKYFGKLYDINAQSKLPKNPPTPGLISGKRGDKYSAVKRPESNGVFLPKINNNKLDVSTTTLSNETKSVHSHLTTGQKFLRVSQNQAKMHSNKPKEIYMLEQECREAIEKAKAEWKFTNKEAEDLLVKKIQKKYKNKIQKLLYKNA